MQSNTLITNSERVFHHPTSLQDSFLRRDFYRCKCCSGELPGMFARYVQSYCKLSND